VGDSLYTTAGVHTTVLSTESGCDSTVILTLTVHPIYTYSLVEEICEGDTYEVGDSVYTETGNYVTNLLTINGCDSIVTVDLTVHPVYVYTLTEEICELDTFVVGDSLYTATGIYVTNMQTVEGCDSIVTLDLTVHPVYTTNLIEEICDQDTFGVGDSIYTQTGIYTTVLSTIEGCDSTVILDLTVHPIYAITLTHEICEGESYEVGDSVYTTSEVFVTNLTTVEGCDSIVTLNLTVHPVYAIDLAEAICEGDSFPVGDSLYTTTGIYVTNMQTVEGCDSIVTLDLTVHPVYTTNLVEEICDEESFPVGDSLYTETGIYTTLLSTINGCDSTVVLDLTVHPIYLDTIVVEICDGAVYQNGASVFTTTGVYPISYLSENNCDSLVVIDLTVHPVYNVNLVESICDGESYPVGDTLYTEAGNYTNVLISVEGCDSIVNLELTVIDVFTFNLSATICEGDSYLVGGDYQTEPGIYNDTLIGGNGCPQYLITTLYVNPVYLDTMNVVICEGEGYLAGGDYQMETGWYVDSLLTINNCDSVIVTNLLVSPTNQDTSEVFICDGESYYVAGADQTESGVYTDTLQNSYNCDSVIVTVLEVMDVFYTAGVVNICKGDSIELGGGYQTESGFYIDTLSSNANGCDSIVVSELVVNTTYAMEYEETICDGDSVLINGVYETEAGVYTDGLTTTTGCDSLVTVTLNVLPTIELLAADESICLGESIDMYVSGSDLVTWSPDTGLSCSDCIDPIASPTETTTYTVSAVGCQGAIVEIEVTVYVNTIPEVAIISDASVLKGDSTILIAEVSDPSATLVWSTEEGEICTGCTKITVSPQSTATYTLEAYSDAGCSSLDQFVLRVDDACIYSNLEIPNIISPNGDGANDEFLIQYEGVSDVSLLRIYNRWGELIFETNDITGDLWDGTFRGQALSPGVYVYYLEGTCLNNKPFTVTGNVTVLK